MFECHELAISQWNPSCFPKVLFLLYKLQKYTLITLKGLAGHGNYDILSSYP